ncbi:hypothetical protein AD428_09275 [Achromobacter sp. DMS1]|nr:hypothetical protein AD428_09275 [Achromobacter sp. DMS1]
MRWTACVRCRPLIPTAPPWWWPPARAAAHLSQPRRRVALPRDARAGFAALPRHPADLRRPLVLLASGGQPRFPGARGWQWLANRRIVSGGSTLTMQVARLIDPQLAGRPSRTLGAKLRQAWRAVQLEMHYSKDEILSLYLTHAPMGGIVEGVGNGGADVAWASRPADLSAAEAALLTALPQAPSRLRPDRPSRGPRRRSRSRSRTSSSRTRR